MTSTFEWTGAPDGQVLMPGVCGARDGDGQAGAFGVVAGEGHDPAPTRLLRTHLATQVTIG